MGCLRKKGLTVQMNKEMEGAMEKYRKVLMCVSYLAAAALIVIAPASQTSAAETAEEYIEQARPFLHFSCEGAWEGVNRDEDAYLDILNKVVAIHFINYNFDIKKLEALPDLEERRVTYYNEIGRMCRETPTRSLVGAIERALVDTFAKLPTGSK